MANGQTKTLQEDEGGLGGPKFSPPLYQQRYAAVVEVARKLQAKKVVDMGCAECKLLWQLKREPYIEELVGVDVDRLLLNMHQATVHPLTTDYLHPREKPLHFALMHGSIAKPDVRLMNFDLLACIEVIEHLDPPVLESVPCTIFGVLCPKIVVMTTPNSEFNVLFPGFTGFRHPDHRFEWSRAEFQSWCNGIAGCYGYDVEYSGIGEPPLGREDVGCCSQMATFTLSTHHRRNCDSVSTPYTIVSEANHPYLISPLSPEKKLCSEVEYYLGVLLRQRKDSISEEQGGDGNEFDTSCVSIKLKDVLQFPKVSALCSSVSEIQCSLNHSHFIQLDATGTHAVFPREPPDCDLASSDSESDESRLKTDQTSFASCIKLETEEDWDND